MTGNLQLHMLGQAEAIQDLATTPCSVTVSKNQAGGCGMKRLMNVREI